MPTNPAAIEAARRPNGEFGEQPRPEPGIDVVARLCPATPISAEDMQRLLASRGAFVDGTDEEWAAEVLSRFNGVELAFSWERGDSHGCFGGGYLIGRDTGGGLWRVLDPTTERLLMGDTSEETPTRWLVDDPLPNQSVQAWGKHRHNVVDCDGIEPPPVYESLNDAVGTRPDGCVQLVRDEGSWHGTMQRVFGAALKDVLEDGEPVEATLVLDHRGGYERVEGKITSISETAARIVTPIGEREVRLGDICALTF